MIKKTIQNSLACALVLGGAFTPVFASDFDVYLHSVESGTEAQRVTARRMLPREGVRAVAPLIELLQHEDQLVWRNARNILADITNQVAGPGFDAEQIQVTDQLIALVQAEATPPHAVQEGLRLLGIVTPKGYDLTALEIMWGKEEYKAELLSALVIMGAPEAQEFLQDRLIYQIKNINWLGEELGPQGSPQEAIDDFVLFLNAFRTMDTKNEIDFSFIHDLLGVYTSVRPTEQWRTLRPYAPASLLNVIAPTGDIRYFSAVEFLEITAGIAKSEVPPEQVRMFADAYFEYTEALILAGGNWDKGINKYIMALYVYGGNAETPAITGLGKYGDERMISPIMDKVKENPELEAPALMGLDDMKGLASYEALLEAYPKASYEMQLGLLGVFGRKQDAIFLPLLLENAASEDRARQTAAFGGLVQSDLAGGVDAVVKYVTSVPEEDRRFPIDDLLAYADRMHNQGKKEAAGKAYLGLYRTASEQDDKDIAFQGIKQYPSAEAYDLILADLDFDNLDDVSAETLIALNVMIKEESNPEAFAKIRKALAEVVKETAHVESVLRMAAQQNALEQFLPLLGYVKEWHIVGVFPWSSAENFTANPVGAPAVDLTANYTVDGKSIVWKKIDAGLIVNLMGIYGSKTNSAMYAYTTIHSNEAIDAQLRVGSDDGVRIWFNGVSVHENNIDRGVDIDQDIVDVKLKKGENKILLQVTQGGGGWGYTFRVTHRDGAPFLAQ